MSYKVYYAGVPLHDYVTVLNIKRTVLPSRENVTKNVSGRFGSVYLGYKYAAKSIVLNCLVTANSKEEYLETIKDLSFILDVDSPKKMTIDDCPDRYCYAVLNGDTDVEKSKHNGELDLEFMCYDPYDYALEWQSVDAEHMSSVNPVTRLAMLHNSGSVDTYPYITINFLKNAYFAQCSNVYGETVLIGSPPNLEEENVDISAQTVLIDE